MIKIFIFLTLFFADFISKKIISNLINLNEFFFVTFFLDIVHVHNFGISFGLFSGKISSGLLIFIGLIISVVILFMMKYAENSTEKWGYLVILIGAFSNIFDRMLNGFVIDFIYLHYKDFYWPAFNFADIYITVGVCIIAIQTLKGLKDKSSLTK